MKIKKIRKVKLGNKKYKIAWSISNKDDFGFCEPPDAPVKRRYIGINLQKHKNDQKELMSTLLHEGLHALKWGLSEKDVTKMSDDLAALVWKVGFRLV